MIIPLMAGALMCATPKLKDNTGTKWTAQDQAVLLEIQKDGCRKRNPNEPCLYVFEKVKDGEYNASCGPEQRRKDD